MSDTILAQGEEQNIFLIPNATIIVELVIILVVLGVVWRFIVPPIQKAMGERHDRIQQQLDDADRANKRFAEADQRYRDALSEARNESAKIRDEARGEGNRIVEEMRESANAEVARIRQQGETQLAEQRDRVVHELRDSVGELSTKLAGRVLGSQMEGPANRARVGELLDARGQPQETGHGVKGGSR